MCTPDRRAFLWGAAVLMTGLASMRKCLAGPSASEIFSDPRIVELLDAAMKGDSRRVAGLVASGADLSTRGDKDVTLLQWAMLNKSPKGFTALLNAGADPAQPGVDGDGAIHFAAMANDPEYLRLLLARRSNPDAPNALTGRTPLMSALMGGRDLQFDMLLSAGASPGLADHMGNTPLHVAAQVSASGAVLKLLDAGSPPSALNRQGKTFQTYFFMTPDRLLNAEARDARRKVTDWLAQRGLPVEK